MFNKKERIAASVVLVSSLTGCVVPVLDSTPPPAEVTEAAASKSVALIFDRTEASKITNSEARAIVNGQLDQVAALCKEGFGEKMKVGSESYLMGVDTDGSASIWGFCEAEVDGQMVVVVNSFNSENNELDTKINKKMVVFEDNSVGYEDESGRHIILQHRPGDKYDVLDIDGYAIVRWEDAGEGDYNSILTWMLNIGVSPVSAEALTSTPPPAATETAMPTEDSRWETPDAALTEQIKSGMPTMWFYDREAKSFVERSADDFSFRIFERTTLYIYDKEGNEIGFARYFTGANLENENTEYYSLVDESVNSIIPMRLYSQMGDYIPSGSTVAPQCMFAFSDEPNQNTVPNPNQSYYDFNHNLTSDMLQISSGEELMQVGLIRTVAMIKGVSEDQIVADLKSNVPIVISFGDKQWEVNKGIDFFWSNSSTSGFDVKDGRLISYDGGQSPRSYPCGEVFVGQGIIGTAIYTYYGGEAAQISSAYLSPVITADKFMTSTVSLKRDK